MTNPSLPAAPPPVPTLLFLDVDGPLIPFGGTPEQYPDGYPTYRPARRLRVPESGANPLLPRIDPALGPRLAALACELVWATTWMDEANECVAPWLGLPDLPVVHWPEPAPDDLPGGPGVHWKTRPLVDRAAGRDFVWVDDEVTDADRRWVAEHHPGRALLHRVDPHHGLLDADFAAVEAWLRS
ncbi:HAD domain-containing protein [Streptomyces lacrimifluminis]|uniref:Secreted protein n=1 Tax=Streptomyces lacrimifluminis TaxID=1500077 RepID=A0A917NM19_9ACTN|nr:HAD domain-containing protein [Streptomyces lacrimifluminis]GGJ07964.1 hypothetical protein GCM10012282_00800 [Streptomyces lacrimifluminis]